MAYSGNIAHVTLGQAGLLTDQPPGDIPRGALIKAFNVSYETGVVTKAPGSLRYNTQVLPSPIIALFDWHPRLDLQRLIAVCANGSIYRDTGDRLFSNAVPIFMGLSNLNPSVDMVEGGQETAGRDKKLFLFTGTNQVKVSQGDEATFSDIDLPAADWTSPNFPPTGLIHHNRLWVFMKQRAYASDTGNHENFQTNFLTQAIFPGEGGDITGVHVFKGRLFAFKQGGFVYYLEDQDPDSENWVWRKLASNFGLSSPHGIFEVGNDMIAVNESGSPVSYNAVLQLGDIESADLLRLLQIEDYFRGIVTLNGLDVIHTLYYEAKKQAFITYRMGFRQKNNLLLHLDFNREQPRVAFWSKDQADCMALRKDINKIPRPIYGSADGYVYLMDREDRLVGGSAYLGEFKTGHMDFRFLGEQIANKNKLFDRLKVEFIPMGSWNVDIDVYIDGTFSETIPVLMDVRDDGLDTFTLDKDPLGREEAQTIEVPLHGSGRRISFHVKQAGANQNFAIASLDVGFRLSAEQATRV